MSEVKSVHFSPGTPSPPPPPSPANRNRGWNRVLGKHVGKPAPSPKPKETKVASGIEELADVIFDCEDGKMTGNFEVMMDKLSTYVGGKFEHGGELLIAIKTMTVPELKIPDPAAANATEVEKEIWKLELVAFVKKRCKIADNLKRCYAVIWGQCTEYMKAKLRATKEFVRNETEQEAIKLLISIKGLIFKFDEKRYHPCAIVDALDRFHKFFQGHEMTNPQYLARFTSLVTVIEQYDGTVGVHKGMYRE